jgi:GDPmannose 4,6-dehydratase
MNKTALISGVSGQDGYYLSKYLLDLGYRVVGIVRRTSTPNDTRLRTLKGTPNFVLVDGDITDISSIQRLVKTFQPDEFYHLAAQSHVALSWEYPIQTAETTGIGVLNCLEALKQEKPDCRFYFAGSSEQFGNSIQGKFKVFVPGLGYKGLGVRREPGEVLLNEDSLMNPESPYAAAKVFGYNITQVYRRSYDMFASCGILFNHESPLRGENFVTRKITSQLARVKWGLQEYVELGNLNSYRDWGFAGDYVRAMHAMLQHDEPDDFVIATGETYSVQEFVSRACNYFQLDPHKVIKINPKFIRPKDVDVLIGNSEKARQILNWTPKYTFEELVQMMCKYDDHRQSTDPQMVRMADEYLGG